MDLPHNFSWVGLLICYFMGLPKLSLQIIIIFPPRAATILWEPSKGRLACVPYVGPSLWMQCNAMNPWPHARKHWVPLPPQPVIEAKPRQGIRNVTNPLERERDSNRIHVNFLTNRAVRWVDWGTLPGSDDGPLGFHVPWSVSLSVGQSIRNDDVEAKQYWNSISKRERERIHRLELFTIYLFKNVYVIICIINLIYQIKYVKMY